MKMSVTIFVHLNELENNNFDIRRFNKDIEIKYPGTSFEVNNSALFYDLCWENYSEKYQFELRMEKKRCTFAIDWCYPVIKRRMILYNGYKVSSNKS